MMRIETIMVGQMGTNCYLAWDEESKRGFLVDPGEQADKIIRVCSRYEIKPEAILLTHGHFDPVSYTHLLGTQMCSLIFLKRNMGVTM